MAAKVVRTVLLALAAAALGSAARAADACAALGGLKLTAATLTAAATPAGFEYPATSMDAFSGRTPVARPFCRVQGVIDGHIRFEVWLPEAGAWNGRLMGTGNGGMMGAILYTALAGAVGQGYAVVGSNLGHDGGPVDGDWARGHPELVIDWGHRATHEMTARAKAIVRAYYGRAQSWSYFTGCSGGGRQALMEAQRYPQDYDGIVAGDPTINFTGLTTGGRLWMAQSLFAPGAAIPAAKLALATRAAVAECDPQDGVVDGVIDDPRTCRFDPMRIRCADADRDDCLTEAQALALRKVYEGPKDAQGRTLFPGYERGAETTYNAIQGVYATGFLRGLGFEDAAYDPAGFDYARDIPKLKAKPVGAETLSRAIDAADPDLSAFRRRGGKLIHYHGWNDGGVPPRNSLGYYEQVTAKSGPTKPSFYRLFLVPGLEHCVGGPGATRFDMLAAVQQWVEKGVAPDRIPAARLEAGKVVRTRPLCPYPQRAVWDGKGDTDKAESFRCKAPGWGSDAPPQGELSRSD